VQPTAKRFNAIHETDEPRAVDRRRASDSVVAHDDRRKRGFGPLNWIRKEFRP
jgi:hypothetical protein